MYERINVDWKEFNSCEDAKDSTYCVYVHERDERAYYVGMIGFRKTFDGRYGQSYRHWIDSCLEYGSKLHIGTVQPLYPQKIALSPADDDLDMKSWLEKVRKELNKPVKAVEDTLIYNLRPVGNKRRPVSRRDIVLTFSGSAPIYVRELAS